MSQSSSSPIMSPGGIFARIESLKKWQIEQQKRLLQQQTDQQEFLSSEHKRMYEALGLETPQNNYPSSEQTHSLIESRTEHRINAQTTSPCNDYDTELGVSILEVSDDEPETQDDVIYEIVDRSNIDEIPIKSPIKDFTALLEEKLKGQNEKVPIASGKSKPKRPFLKRGAGLSRFRMSIDDLAYKQKPRPVYVSNRTRNENRDARKENNTARNEKSTRNENKSYKNENKARGVTFKPLSPPKIDHLKLDTNAYSSKNESFKICKPILKKPTCTNSQDQMHRASWTRVTEQEPKAETPENNQKDYKALLEELIEMRQSNPGFFEQTMNVSENQKQFENELVDELKLFELLEQNVANSSFCSTSSLVTRLMEHSVKTTPNRGMRNVPNTITTEDKTSQIFKKPEISNNISDCNLDSKEKQFQSCLINNTIKSTPKQFVPAQKSDIQFEETPIKTPHVKFKIQENLCQNDSTNVSNNGQANSKCAPRSHSSNTSTKQLEIDDSDNSSVNSDDISNVNDIKTITDEHTWSDDWEDVRSDKIETTSTSNSNSVVITVADAATNTEAYIHNYSISSEMLKSRLEELEQEIATFRTENSRLHRLKFELETDTRNFNKRKRQLEKDFEEKQKELNAHIDEEKRKVTRERAVYDRYTREMRNKTTKKEKEEITLLQTQLANVKEELKLKESRWGATQARFRNQIKHLEKDNVSLKADNEELRKKNGRLEATQKQLTTKKPSDTKMLHEINKNLTKLAKEAKIVVPKTVAISSTAKYKAKQQSSKSETKKRLTVQTSSEDEKQDEESEEDASDTDPTLTLLNISKIRRKNKENDRNSLNVSTSNDSIKSKSSDRSFESIERDYEKVFGKTLTLQHSLPTANSSRIDESYKKSRDEKLLEDGSKQITYSNGNVKTVSPDGDLTIMKYYNGDVKETCYSTGTIKYLYAEAGTWHTTYPDGHEILEFPNGQIEKRFKDSSSEICFPNGCQRCVSPGGTEEIRFPDGTVLVNNGSGQKILNLPNGQKEIHAEDHKRREYPDGTVKLLYPDGIQETRYANGRIRLKDKEGNLIMDSGSI